MDRRPNAQTISWFVDLRTMKRLDLNPQYQRKSVWNLQYRKFFVDTILRNYPCPTVFLVKQYEDNMTPNYGVVDGKQRLTTIFSFLDGEFPTQSTDDELELSERYFNELPENYRRIFLDYPITIEVLGDTSPVELREAFDRMNRNVAKLNAQELRHARYSGDFIKFCENWTQNPWFQNSAVCTGRRTDRMSDVEFVSELIVLTERGIQDGKSVLDDVYAEYDDGITDKTRLYARFDKILRDISAIGLSNTSSDPFGRLVDIYALWAALRDARSGGRKIDAENTRLALVSLSENIRGQSSDDGRTYYVNSQRQTNSRSSRTRRAEVISKYLAFQR